MSDDEYLTPQLQPAVTARIIPANIPLPPPLDMNGEFGRTMRSQQDCETKTRLVRLPCSLALAPTGLEVFDGLNFDNDTDRTKIALVLQKLEAFCIEDSNETYERYKFNRRDREVDESIKNQ
ncbi:Hypothetical predicted protein [Paramuricea clavata]|uniref:Uncharacterized protein n=1 Tax=Paramuricea clavata TaxID=317549 RepID=A0A6S7FLB8_PARCT|nr:Hypothetical predicted protein [Paramuricea clavata]